MTANPSTYRLEYQGKRPVDPCPCPVLGPVTVSTHGASIELRALIGDAGERAAHASFEFFTAPNPESPHPRGVPRAVLRFAALCERAGLPLQAVRSVNVAAYLARARISACRARSPSQGRVNLGAFSQE